MTPSLASDASQGHVRSLPPFPQRRFRSSREHRLASRFPSPSLPPPQQHTVILLPCHKCLAGRACVPTPESRPEATDGKARRTRPSPERARANKINNNNKKGTLDVTNKAATGDAERASGRGRICAGGGRGVRACVRIYTYPICGVRPRPFSKARRRWRHTYPCPCRPRLAAPRSSSVQLPPGNLAASAAVAAAATARSASSSSGEDLAPRAMALARRQSSDAEQRASERQLIREGALGRRRIGSGHAVTGRGRYI